jgi:hypothetical protein
MKGGDARKRQQTSGEDMSTGCGPQPAALQASIHRIMEHAP